MITGLTLGKYMPFHKGHMALIDYAKSNCDKLIVLVAALPGEPIPYKYRLKWVLSTYLDDPAVEVFGDIVNEPQHVTSDEKSKWWGNYVTQRFGKIDRIFSSESYGKVFAEAAGAENWVFDKSRNIVPVSATMIRTKPLTNWDYLNNFAKDYFVKKIAIVGTESTGKTTLAQQLAEHYKTQWVPEVGRELIPDSNDFTIDDLKIVGTEHAKSILKHTRLSNKVLFIDTDLITTKSYAKFFFDEIPTYDPWVEKANKIDYYIYLDSSAPYVDDGTRLSKAKRDLLDKSHREMFALEGADVGRGFHFYDDTHFTKGMEPYEYRYKDIVEYIDWIITKL